MLAVEKNRGTKFTKGEHYSPVYLYSGKSDSGKLSREKTFTNFEVLGPSAKVFSAKSAATHTHNWWAWASNP